MHGAWPATSEPGEVLIGVAGWDYPDWEGVVYPRAGRGFDRLAYLSKFIDVVEVNSTFYRIQPASTAARWAKSVRGRAQLCAKAHRTWTHDADPDVTESVARTLSGLEPLREAGALIAVLAQFPQRFHADDRAWSRLERIAESTRGWPIAIEVRHASWGSHDAVERIRALGLAWCVVDQPRIAGATLGPEAQVTAPFGYFRLHGRNARDWFREDAGRDARYDYRYTRPEIQELSATAASMARRCTRVAVVQNNHFRGQALVNALEMRAALDGRRGIAPAPLLRAYPDLADFADPDEPSLF